MIKYIKIKVFINILNIKRDIIIQKIRTSNLYNLIKNLSAIHWSIKLIK
jgi:hypothetical protein